MLEFLPSARDVIALQITGKLDHDSALHLIEVLEAAVSANDKTHVFAEIIDFSGMDFTHLPQYIGRAVPFLGKLTRLGRVAVVSDQAWLRALARLESAILPHVSYETFTSEERERALAWVEGGGALHGPALKVIETGKADVLGFEIDGKLTRQEIEAAADYFGARL